jgi:hypothetical protein
MRNENRTPSVKPYILGVAIWCIFLLVVYEERLPELSLRIVETFQNAYLSIEALFHHEPPSLLVRDEGSTHPEVPSAQHEFYGTERILHILNPQAATSLNPHLSSQFEMGTEPHCL